jgi:predicted anti-sigma-YlaC factor YlaD
MKLRLARLFAWLTLLALVMAPSSCSLRRFAANSVANTLASGPDVFSTDDDPDLVRDAVPFGLKTMESLLQIVPKNRNLLLAACRGFTQYAYAFVQSDADAVEFSDHNHASELRDRARRLFVRARDYGLKSLELGYRGVTQQLSLDPGSAVKRFRVKDVPNLYWTAAAWGSAISLGKDRPELVADLPAVRALFDRAVSLDEGFDGGALHEALIVLEALPPAIGGNPQAARAHFERAIALSHGTNASPYLTYAQSVAVMNQNRAEFHGLLEKALAVDVDRDPPRRLANIVTQRRAKWLLEHEDDFFLDSGSPADTTSNEESR